MPFEATVDSTGRLAAFTYTFPPYTLAPAGSVPATEVRAIFAHFGTPVMVDKPANAVDAPPDFYRLIGAG